MSLAGLLLLTSAAFAQEKRKTPAASARPAPSTVVEQPVPAVVDGRTVKVVGGRLSPESIAKIQAAFNRRLPRDLRTYTLGQIIDAAEAAAAEETSPASTARIRCHVTVRCCPLEVELGCEWGKA